MSESNSKFIFFGLSVVVMSAVVATAASYFFINHQEMPRLSNSHAETNNQTVFLAAKVDQLMAEVKKVSRAESLHVTSEIKGLIESAKGEIVVNVQDVGDRVSRTEGRMDALTMNKDYTKVFYPVGQEDLFFKHFPETMYRTHSKTSVKNGSVLGFEYTVKRKINIPNYVDPYTKKYDLSPNSEIPRGDMPVAH